MASFGVAKRAICESILHKNHIFHQFANVFSLESFPLYMYILCIVKKKSWFLAHLILPQTQLTNWRVAFVLDCNGCINSKVSHLKKLLHSVCNLEQHAIKLVARVLWSPGYATCCESFMADRIGLDHTTLHYLAVWRIIFECRDGPTKNDGHIKSAQMTHSKCLP